MTVAAVTTTAAQVSAIDWNALLVAGIGIGGVLVGGLIQIGGNEVVWKRQRKLQLLEEERLKGLTALALAEHLESYVLHCADVVGSFWDVDWVSPVQWTSASGEGPSYLQPLSVWPELVNWKLLGLQAAVDASNFKRRTELVKATLVTGSNFLEAEDSHCENADKAAELGLDAWAMAKLTRKTNGLEPLDTSHTWDFIESLTTHIEKRTEFEARRAASHEAMVQAAATPAPAA